MLCELAKQSQPIQCLGQSGQPVWDVSELEAKLGGELSRELEVLRHDVSHAGKHGDPQGNIALLRVTSI